MPLTITALNPANYADLDQVDNHFIVDSRLVLHAEDGQLRWTIAPVAAYRKEYPPEHEDYAQYINTPDKAAFLAYNQDQLVGQVILCKAWNHFALVEDIAVAPAFRQQGVGRALLDRAAAWARERDYPGLSLETQDINTGACLFYARYGFTLGGFDRFLYRAIPDTANETALYWYLLF